MRKTLIHREWTDSIILSKNNRLYRINIKDEYGDFILDKNILYINWDKWNKEIFISHNNDNNYYLCEEINLFGSYGNKMKLIL